MLEHTGRFSLEISKNKQFDILVEYAGASETLRDAFVRWNWYVVHEFRFQGKLGFGGKFWINTSTYRNNGEPYIDCYPEDMTPERQEIIETVNRLLADLE